MRIRCGGRLPFMIYRERRRVMDESGREKEEKEVRGKVIREEE